MRASTGIAARRYKLLPALTAVVSLLSVSSVARDLTTIHLPGKISSDAEVGLALSAPDTLYAAYWTEAGHGEPWSLCVYALDIASGKLLGRSELDRAQPLRSRNGDVIQTPTQLFLSADGSLLLCGALEGRDRQKIWLLTSRPLRVISSTAGDSTNSDVEVVGFTRTGNVRLLHTRHGGTFGQEIDSATVTDLDARSLDKVVSRRLIQFQEPVWRLVTVDSGDLLWVLDERPSPKGDPRITAYSLGTGKPLLTREVSLASARAGVPSPTPRPRGAAPPPPTAISPPGTPRGTPQLPRIVAAAQAAVVEIDQPAEDWKAWSRLLRFDLASSSPQASRTLEGCNLGPFVQSRGGHFLLTDCSILKGTIFDEYGLAKEEAVLVSGSSGGILWVEPLNKTNSLSLAIDDSGQSALIAIYDHRATVRLLSVPQ